MVRVWTTSFPGSLLFTPQEASWGVKRRDPGNEVGVWRAELHTPGPDQISRSTLRLFRVIARSKGFLYLVVLQNEIRKTICGSTQRSSRLLSDQAREAKRESKKTQRLLLHSRTFRGLRTTATWTTVQATEACSKRRATAVPN